jgi:hypothetical protein
MGSIATLYFSGYPVNDTKNYLDQWIFKEQDKRIFERRVADRNILAWGEAVDKEELETAYVFELTVDTAIKRLEFLGYTLSRCRIDFQESLNKDLKTLDEITFDTGFPNLCRDIYSRYSDWNQWSEAFSVITKDQPRRIYDFCEPERVHEDDLVNYMMNPQPAWLDDWNPWGFQYPCNDFNYLARTFLESCERDSPVQLDATDLVLGGWCDDFMPLELIGGPHTKFFTVIEQNINEALDLIEQLRDHANSSLLSKLLFANSITLLETYLSDTLIFAVENFPPVMRRLVEADPGFGRIKIETKDIFRKHERLKSEVVAYLESLMYHNLSKVKHLYLSSLRIEFPSEIDVIYRAINDRHDIVHRNGRRKDGSMVSPDLNSVKDLLLRILQLVRVIDIQVKDAYPEYLQE